ncbi:MAG: type II toxin-antitoxin system Phd/YefM family antitoxin [Myxococcota bacterium]|nr:type II toxin-antitoxin system Phd/YefM family antitoxin [Myxococcota bacterium]
MRTVAITEFKARCLSLLEDVARTGEPLVVTKRGKPLARVIPSGPDVKYPQDTLAGTVEIVGDVVAPVFAAGAWNASRGVLLSQEDAPTRARKARRR